jgi:hypothetical protein
MIAPVLICRNSRKRAVINASRVAFPRAAEPDLDMRTAIPLVS